MSYSYESSSSRNVVGAKSKLRCSRAGSDTDILTTRVCLAHWNGDVRLEAEYARLVHAIANHKPRTQYSVILHGSALWGDRTNLRTGYPISDVDVLIIGETESELSVAASALKSIAQRHGVSAVPLFKLGVKFRTVDEIATPDLSANELAAFMHGSVLVGKSDFEILRPDERWFHDQAKLSVATRLIYVAEQQNQISASKYEWVLSRYLAARLILDIATVGLLLKGITGPSYTSRVTTFLSECLRHVQSQFVSELQSTLARALETKRDPEGYQCMNISGAANLLLRWTRAFGLTDPVPQDAVEFWQRSRPLDLRDRTLWKTSGR